MSDLHERLAALSPEQRALFEARLKKKGLSIPKSQVIRKRKGDGPWPLSIDQEQLWVVDQIDPGTAAYNVHTAMSLTGPLDAGSLARAINEIIKRHEILRTTFQSVHGRPVQVIHTSLSLPVPVTDISSRHDALQEAIRLAVEEIGKPFDLARGPLIRVRLLRLSASEYVFVVVMHHIAADSWSFGVFNQELWALYSAFSRGEAFDLDDLPIQFADFAIWQRGWFDGELLEEKLAYWKRQLAGAPSSIGLPADYTRPLAQTYRGATRYVSIPASTTKALKGLAQREMATMFMTMLAAFDTLLFRYSGQGDIVVGSPIANRNYPEVENLIGYFLNMLVLRTQLAADMTFRELLAHVREVALEAYARQDVPFAKLVQELQPERDIGRNPLFQVSFVYLDFGEQELELQGLKTRPLKLDSGNSMFDLTLGLTETPDGLEAFFEYSTELFDSATINRMIGHFQTLLESIISNPDLRLWELPMMSEKERQDELYSWNNRLKYYSTSGCLHELFERQAERSPDQTAVVADHNRLTYSQLNRRANQLAHHLSARGVGADTVVGICLERSAQMVVAVLGVLKAGGAYVPLDPAYPPQRLAFLLKDSRAQVLLTQQRLLQSLPDCEAERICLDLDWQLIARHSDKGAATSVSPDNLAYVIYTSGSTGEPKGVMISHRAIVNRLLWEQHAYPLNESDRVLQITSLSFDVSVCEIFAPLCSGAQLMLAEPEGQKDGPYIVKTIAEQEISFINLVPSMLQVLVEEPGVESCKSLRRVYCGGEVMPAQLKERFFARSSAMLLNLYGPTESTVDTTYWVCEQGGDRNMVPIGQPIDNVEVLVLDAHLQPVPVGVAGELYIGGASLARGYLNRPDLTAERFIPNPFTREPGTRLYKTGDIARRLPDGNIVFAGRSDNQVKIRGMRIELGEIENVLMQLPGVKDVVVTAREYAKAARRLAAYALTDSGDSFTSNELREFARQRLPNYMVPTWFISMQSFPLMPNGKIDRGALPPPEQAGFEPRFAHAMPRNAVEETLARIWAESLGLEKVGIHDNFFHLGGDSILSIQIVSKANDAGYRISPRQLFQYQTVAELAAISGTAPALAATQGVITGEAPLTPIQRWFFEQGFTESHHWNQAILLESIKPVDPAITRHVVQAVVEHHDALRLRFYQDGERWQQTHTGIGEQALLTLIDLSSLTASEQQKAVEVKAAELQSSLNLSEGPLIEVCQFHLGADRPCLLLIVIHHLVVDGVSWRILLEDMQKAYRLLSNGEAPGFGRKTTSFKQWAELLREHAQSDEVRDELSYWLIELSRGFAPVPVDYPGGVNLEASARSISVSLDKKETRALLNDVPASYRTQINDVLVAAFAETLALWMPASYVMVEVEGHGREDVVEGVDVSRTVGWFTTIYPIALRLEKARDITMALKEIKEQLRSIPKRGIGYGLLRYLSEDAAASQLQEVMQAEISFNYLGQLDQALDEKSGFRLAKQSPGPTHAPRARRSHLLEIEGRIVEAQLQIVWGYSENLHRHETVDRLAQNYMAALRRLIAHCRSGEALAFTPSDFPEAKLSQTELDRFIAGVITANKE